MLSFLCGSKLLAVIFCNAFNQIDNKYKRFIALNNGRVAAPPISKISGDVRLLTIRLVFR